MLRNHDRRDKALYVKRWVTKRYNDGLARANVKNNFISCNYRLHVTQVVQIKTREMRKDLERAGNILKKIKNPLTKHVPEHTENGENKDYFAEAYEAARDADHKMAGAEWNPEAGKWEGHDKEKLKAITGVVDGRKYYEENNPLPKNKTKRRIRINLPQISFERKPKPQYFKRRNMMAKNQITRK